MAGSVGDSPALGALGRARTCSVGNPGAEPTHHLGNPLPAQAFRIEVVVGMVPNWHRRVHEIRSMNGALSKPRQPSHVPSSAAGNRSDYPRCVACGIESVRFPIFLAGLIRLERATSNHRVGTVIPDIATTRGIRPFRPARAKQAHRHAMALGSRSWFS